MIIRDSHSILAELTKLEEVIAVVEEQCKRELSEQELEMILKALIKNKMQGEK